MQNIRLNISVNVTQCVLIAFSLYQKYSLINTLNNVGKYSLVSEKNKKPSVSSTFQSCLFKRLHN
jgi:hypothetical protein